MTIYLDAPVRTGEPYALVTPSGERLTGTVELHLPQRELFDTVRELGDGVFRLSLHRAAGQTRVSAWLSTCGPDDPGLPAFEAAARRFFDRAFAAGRPRRHDRHGLSTLSPCSAGRRRCR